MFTVLAKISFCFAAMVFSSLYAVTSWTLTGPTKATNTHYEPHVFVVIITGHFASCSLWFLCGVEIYCISVFNGL